ncbi:MAG: RAD55 family ATPase [Thermoplasmata archaeon]
MSADLVPTNLSPWQPLPAPRASPAGPADLRVPTGVADFDSLSGGIPLGSVVLLLGEAGAGHQEFALTSATHLMFHHDEERMHRFFLGAARGNFQYPDKVAYLSLTRSREQVLQEVRGSFDPLYLEVLERHLKFGDLSPEYFADSVVPAHWATTPAPLLTAAPAPRFDGGGPLAAVARGLEEVGPSNVVIVDSLTDLLVRRGIATEDLLTLVKGLRRRAKGWDGLVYLLLSKGVAAPDTEQALIDSVDGVLAFSWTANPLRSNRQRVMVIPKFMPVLAHVPHEHQGRFVIRISSLTGLVTTQYERI